MLLSPLQAMHSVHLPDLDTPTPVLSVCSLGQLPSSSLGSVQAHLDGGAQTSTTDQRHLLCCYKPFTPSHPCPVRLKGVDENALHVPLGIGIMKVPSPTPSGYLPVPVYFTPQIPNTILSPSSFRPFLVATLKAGLCVLTTLLAPFLLLPVTSYATVRILLSMVSYLMPYVILSLFFPQMRTTVFCPLKVTSVFII